MTDYECDTVVASKRDQLYRSATGFGENAKVESVRTSMSARMNRNENAVSERLYRRLAAVVNMPQEIITNNANAESINIVYYEKTQEYTPHFDSGADGSPNSRFLSGIMYFNTPDQAGGTSFPAARDPDTDEEGVTVQAKKGSLMFFYDMLEDGNLDKFSLHSGDPVGEGEKWIGAAWLWEPTQSGEVSDTFREKYQTSTYPSLFDRETGLPVPDWKDPYAAQQHTEL
jgi:prolyl 4-hydroxylase